VGTWLARVGVALAVYTGLAVWLTWPLADHLATHLPNTWPGSRTDPLLLGWALAHESRALLHAPWTFADGGIFHPTPRSLFYGEAAFGALPTFLPVFAATGNPTLALNLTFIGGVAATAAALHLVGYRLTRSHTAGAIAAATFVTAPWVLWTWVPSAPNYGLLALLPVIALAAAKPAPTTGFALGLALLLVLQGLVSAYIAAATLAPLTVLAVVRLLRREAGGGVALALALALAAAALAVAFAGHALVRAENPDWAHAPSLATLGLPVTHLPWGPLRPPSAGAVVPPVLALVAAGLIVRLVTARDARLEGAAWSAGVVWVLVGLVASVSPRAEFAGTPITLPQATLASWTPIYEVLRVPSRLAVAALIGVALLAAAAFAECARRLRARGVWSAGLAAIVVVSMYASYRRGVMVPPLIAHVPLPTTYPLYRPPAADDPLLPLLAAPGGALVELPAGSGPMLQAEAMYRAIYHHRRILNGYSGHLPGGFGERLALACALPEEGALAALRDTTGLELILVDLAGIGRPSFAPAAYRCPVRGGGVFEEDERARDAWRAAAAGGHPGLELVARDGDRLLFRVRAAGAGRGSARP
jgi:hypothetical protein